MPGFYGIDARRADSTEDSMTWRITGGTDRAPRSATASINFRARRGLDDLSIALLIAFEPEPGGSSVEPAG